MKIKIFGREKAASRKRMLSLLPQRYVMRTLLLLFFFPLLASAAPALTTEDMLRQLDEMVAQRQHYRETKEHSIDVMKHKALAAKGLRRVQWYQDIFREYRHVQTDSALAYLDRIERMPEAGTNADVRNFLSIGRAETMAIMGLYTEATALLDSVSTHRLSAEMRLYYFYVCRTVYGWMAKYASESRSNERYERITQRFRDSLLRVLPAGIDRSIVEADNRLTQGQAAAALRILNRAFAAGGQDNVYVLYNLAEAYRQLGDRNRQKYYLAATAKLDMEAGTTEYEALPLLAKLLFEAGDVERAYAYLVRSIEDAGFCKANLRTIEATKIFPIIDQTYKQREAQRKTRMRILIGVLILLATVLGVAIFYLRNRIRRLHQTRRELAATNERLREVYDRLKLTDQMKEEYITHYLDRCRNYLDTLKDFRSEMMKLLKARDYDRLMKELKDGDRIAREQEAFYKDFDQAFLHLFPNFIADFNALLEPDWQIVPKKNELLSTEHRIFALIRLGVTDSSRIAHFLNYSLATIYNYRSKIRSHSVCGKTAFEQRVMEL